MRGAPAPHGGIGSTRGREGLSVPMSLFLQMLEVKKKKRKKNKASFPVPVQRAGWFKMPWETTAVAAVIMA